MSVRMVVLVILGGAAALYLLAGVVAALRDVSRSTADTLTDVEFEGIVARLNATPWGDEVDDDVARYIEETRRRRQERRP